MAQGHTQGPELVLGEELRNTFVTGGLFMDGIAVCVYRCQAEGKDRAEHSTRVVKLIMTP